MRLVRWVRRLYWGDWETPEDKAAHAEAQRLKRELKQQARASGRGRLPRV